MSAPLVDELARRLEQSGERTLGMRGRTRARLAGEAAGWNATVRFFEVDSEAGERSLCAKTFHPRRRRAAGLDVPRLIDLPDWPSPGRQEQAALTRIESGLARHTDARLGVVRVLDYWDDVETLVMERHPGEGLDRALRRLAWRRARAGPELIRGVELAGTWLRAYHELEPKPDAPMRLATPAALREAAERLAPHLPREADHAFRGFMGDAIDSRVRDPLEIATLHGDFVPRNVLVHDASVAVIDTRAPCTAPAALDLARFLHALCGSREQALLGGRLYHHCVPERLGEALLTGYGASPALRESMPVFLVLALGEAWAADRTRARASAGTRGLAKRARLRLLERFHSTRLAALVRENAP